MLPVQSSMENWWIWLKKDSVNFKKERYNT